MCVCVQVCEILLEDIIGVCVSEVPPVNRPLACEMNVHLFPITNPTAKKKVRNQYTAIIQFDGSKEFTENLQVAKEWKAAILLQKQRTLRNTFGTADGDGDDIDGKINGRSFEGALYETTISHYVWVGGISWEGSVGEGSVGEGSVGEGSVGEGSVGEGSVRGGISGGGISGGGISGGGISEGRDQWGRDQWRRDQWGRDQ